MTTTWTKDLIRERLQTSADMVARSVHALWRAGQTEEEKQGRGTLFDNGVGFTGADAHFLSSLAEQVDQGRTLTPGQVAAARRAMMKYAGTQLPHLVTWDPDSCPPDPAQPQTMKTKNTTPLEVRQNGDQVLIRFDRDPRVLDQVRALPARRFDAASRTWIAPLTRENWDAMKQFGWPIRDIPRPKTTGYEIGTKGGRLLTVKVPPSPVNIQSCRDIPDYRTFDGQLKVWVCKPTVSNFQHLKRAFPDASWTPEALDLVKGMEQKAEEAQEMRANKHGVLAQTKVEVTDFRLGGRPRWNHQNQLFLLARDREAFGILMEQGTGKTASLLDQAAYLFTQGKVTGLLVIAPNTVKGQYPEECAEWLPEYLKWDCVVYDASARKADREALERVTQSPADPTRLTVLVMNTESMSYPKGVEVAEAFLARHSGRSMMALDESSKFRNNVARTKAAIKVGQMATYRRILTGTPQPKNPLDWYNQMKFLDPDILGYSSMYSFRNAYCIMGGWQNKEIIGYRNLDDLQKKLDPFVFRVLKDDCLDLPPKVYQKAVLKMTPEQARLYRDMAREMELELDGKTAEVTIVLTQMMRLQQILGGFIPVEDPENGTSEVVPIPGGNPILEDLLNWVEEIPDTGKVIIWSRFRAEVELAAQALAKEYGADAVRQFHGGVKVADRDQTRRDFQDPTSPVRFLVAQIQTGGIGITLNRGTYVYYWSNSFSLEDRLQSEDRSHRGIMEGVDHVLYRDPVFPGTMSEKVLGALREKRELSNMVTGDNWKEWI